MASERLQKVLARAGVASRRNAELLITSGRVRVDGKVVKELGTRVTSRARVELDGRLLEPERLVYIVLNKPRGVVCTLSDPEGRPTIAELLRDAPSRVVPVGRLDFHTSGVLLLTNDGQFASGLAHPKHKVAKVYVAKVQGLVDEDGLARWAERIVINGVRTQPAEVRRLRHEAGKTWLQITLREGKNRQIHRLGEHTGHAVMRLSRLSFAEVTAEGLKAGEWRYLTVDELKQLKKTFGVPARVFAPPAPGTTGRRRSKKVVGKAPPRRSTTQRSASAEVSPARGKKKAATSRASGSAKKAHRGAPARKRPR